MRPILSIFLALITTILLFLGMGYLSQSFDVSFDGFPLFAVIFLGGAITTWFSTENKMRYSAYYAVIVAVVYKFSFNFLFMSYFILLSLIIAGMGAAIAKNEKNTIKNLLNNKFQGKYKNFFMNLYKRNKRVLIASLIIFFAFVLIGGIGPYLSSSFNHLMTDLIGNYLSILERMAKLNTLSLFINNSNNAFVTAYIYGIFFGITSAIDLIYLGIINGFTIVKYPIMIFYLLPHALFEIPAYIIAAAAGFKLSITTLNIIWDGLHIKKDNPVGGQVNKILSVNYLKFRDSLTLFIIAIFLLVIAAIIEANISIVIGNYITGMNIH